MLMDYLNNRIKNLTKEELKECWDNINDYNENGMMGNTLVRQIRNETAKELNDKNWDVACVSITIPEILMEIARRYYKE